jgi:SAM-dependent methyltransferase
MGVSWRGVVEPTIKIRSGKMTVHHRLTGLVDHGETYGSHIVCKMISSLPPVAHALDIGAGGGRDLECLRKAHPAAKTTAIELNPNYIDVLKLRGNRTISLDIEAERLPFPDQALDLVIANQILEHTKEVFWIFHEITRVLKPGGYLLIGVPNVLSLHNRVLSIFGRHPTQHKLLSAHVRPFSKADTIQFLNGCFPDGYKLKQFAGAQFYPLPRPAARAMASLFPNAAFSIFFLFKKTREYEGEFAAYPIFAQLETNYFTGSVSC